MKNVNKYIYVDNTPTVLFYVIFLQDWKGII